MATVYEIEWSKTIDSDAYRCFQDDIVTKVSSERNCCGNTSVEENTKIFY